MWHNISAYLASCRWDNTRWFWERNRCSDALLDPRLLQGVRAAMASEEVLKTGASSREHQLNTARVHAETTQSHHSCHFLLCKFSVTSKASLCTFQARPLCRYTVQSLSQPVQAQGHKAEKAESGQAFQLHGPGKAAQLPCVGGDWRFDELLITGLRSPGTCVCHF